MTSFHGNMVRHSWGFYTDSEVRIIFKPLKCVKHFFLDLEWTHTVVQSEMIKISKYVHM